MLKRFRNFAYLGVDFVLKKRLKDEYIDWLRFANAGMLNPGNVYCINHAFERLRLSSPVVEIGSFCGLSTNVITYLLRKNNLGNRVISADKWIFEGAEQGGMLGKSDIEHKAYREFVKSTYMRNVSFFSAENLPFTIECFSDEFFEKWKKGVSTQDIFDREIKLGGNIGFAYIDGNHTYEFTKRDFHNVDQYLEVGGFILFDDSSDRNPFGLTPLMKEIEQKRSYELVMKNPNYLFRKVR